MSYHRDKEVNSAMNRLLDALCEFERACGRRSTLILIPHLMDERIVIAQDGKPLNPADSTITTATFIFNLAVKERLE